MKPDVVFGLENAAWPALMASANGDILMANAAAKNTFGPVLGKLPVPLASVWAPENGLTAAEFLANGRPAPVPPQLLKFRTPAGGAAFVTAVCSFETDGKTNWVLQLLPATPPSPALPVADARPVAAPDAALKQKLDCLLQLARTVSLDFNNALTGVLAHTSLLLTKAEADHPWRRSLLEVEKSAARAAEIAEELATFSRQEKTASRPPAGNLHTVVTRCIELLKSAHGPRFTWKVVPERSLYVARFDEAKVQQALTKIFENAVEAFPAGGGGQISVQLRNVELTQPTQDRNVRLVAGTYVCAEISDNGAGIDHEAMAKIFEPFFTTKRPPHRGLGLALVYGIISNHGGGVAISSQPGVGTSVRVYLPAERTVIQDAGLTHQELRGTGSVLVVDDEELVLTMAETILSDFGYKVFTAVNGQKALAMLSQPDAKIDLVITDLVMPGIGGRELVERIRQLHPRVTVMPTSGYVLSEDQQISAGYLQKPYTSTELLLKVKAALENRTKVD
jgi:signal transduction histidine kinase